MLRFLNQLLSPPLPIGLDLGRSCVRMLQLETRPAEPARVIAAGQRDLRNRHRRSGRGHDATDDLEATGDAVRDLLRRGGFRGRRVVAALPRSLVQFKTLRINQTSAAELPKLLAKEALGTLGVDLTTGRHLVHFLTGDTLRRGAETHQEGILVVVSKEDVEKFVCRLHGWGAIVAGIDLEPLSLYRSVQRFSRRRRDSQDVQVLVDLGPRSTQVVIGRAGRISFLKTIGIGADAIHSAVGRKLDLSQEDAATLCRQLARQLNEARSAPERAALERDPVQRTVFGAGRAVVEDLARELSLCLRYYCVTFRCRRPDRVLLGGEAAGDPRLAESLAAALPIPVERRQPVLDLQAEPNIATLMSEQAEEWSYALGMALRFAPPGLPGQAGLSRDSQAAADQNSVDLDSLALGELPIASQEVIRRQDRTEPHAKPHGGAGNYRGAPEGASETEEVVLRG